MESVILGGKKFELDSAIFCCGLTPQEFAVYSYLKFCAGSRGACKVKVNTIAINCKCSASSVRRALKELREHGFLNVRADAQQLKNGKTRQTCNRYYLPDASEWRGKTAARRGATGTGEMYQ